MVSTGVKPNQPGTSAVSRRWLQCGGANAGRRSRGLAGALNAPLGPPCSCAYARLHHPRRGGPRRRRRQWRRRPEYWIDELEENVHGLEREKRRKDRDLTLNKLVLSPEGME